jgi:hypothetical protein
MAGKTRFGRNVTKHRKAVFSFLFFLLLVLSFYRSLSVPSRVSASSSGPPASKTGAPGEATCHDCHASYDLNDPSGGVTIGGLPDSYVLGGDPILFSVTVFQDGTNGANIDWGFEITVLDANNRFAGALEVTDMTNTQLDAADVEGDTRFYIKQTSDGTFFNPDGARGAMWTMSWTPPATDVGSVTFYVAGNAGNGDHLRTGDYIFVNNQTVLGPRASAVSHLLHRRHNQRAVLKFASERAPKSVHLGSPDAWLASVRHRDGFASLRALMGRHHTLAY